MALTLSSLKRISNGAARPGQSEHCPGVLQYSTDDAHTDVVGSNYFNAATNYLVQGDIILTSNNLDGTPTHWTFVVTSATGAAAVTVVEQGHTDAT